MVKPPVPIVSVVLPTYNGADLLPEVIASILDQDFKDLELLIVDDGSMDDTERVIHAIQEKDKRLRYYKLSENKGLGFARQAGLEQAAGRYIALADDDDLWLDGKLRTQLEIMENHPEIDILFSDYWNLDYVDHKERKGFDENAAGMRYLITRKIQEQLWLVDSGVDMGVIESNFIAVPTLLVRPSVFEKVGGFNEKLRMATDHEFAFRAAALGAKFAYLDRPLIQRRRYPTSLTANPIKELPSILQALVLCRQLCLSIHREDLEKQVIQMIQRTHFYLIYPYGQRGQRLQAWNSYKNSGPYRFSPEGLALLFASLGGPRVISVIKRIRHPGGHA